MNHGPARHTVAKDGHGHKPRRLLRETTADGSPVYDATYCWWIEGGVELVVDADGNVLERLNRIDEPSGDGP
jgi:hypothetical protein